MIFFKSKRIKQLEEDMMLLTMQVKQMLVMYLDFMEQYYQSHTAQTPMTGSGDHEQNKKNTTTFH